MQVNLVATQLVLDREHTNRLVFVDGQGLDPNMDLKFRGPNLRALIQGPASTWQSHLTLTPTGGSGGQFPLSVLQLFSTALWSLWRLVVLGPC